MMIGYQNASFINEAITKLNGFEGRIIALENERDQYTHNISMI